MKKVTKEIVVKDFNEFALQAEMLVEKGVYHEALILIETCARIAYNFNFTYVDDRLENLLVTIGNSTLPKFKFEPHEHRYVFYDYFGNTKVLTQQYIRALKSWDVEFLYIFSSNENVVSKEILGELATYPKAKAVVINTADQFDRMRQVCKEIADFKPQKAFLHTAPWDGVGVCIWNNFPQVKRYLINLTDHAFWLGKSCSDFLLEFRIYGYNLSYQSRHISKKRLLMQPYYPVQNNTPFQGFPVDAKNKVVGFSGSSFYKIYGRGGKFLKLIKRVLNENPNFIFLLAGWGIDAPVKEFIQQNNFQDRFFLIGNRLDIDQVYKHVDIFINTYPFIGALMTQLAVVNKKAIASYTTPDLVFNYIEDFLNVNRDDAYSIKDEEAFLTEMKSLIGNENFRKRNIDLYANSVPSVEEFNGTLWNNCNNPDQSIEQTDIVEINIDQDAIVNLYLEVENDFLKIYQKLKLRNLGTLYYKHFPFSALGCTLQILFYDFKTVKKRCLMYVKQKLKIAN